MFQKARRGGGRRQVALLSSLPALLKKGGRKIKNAASSPLLPHSIYFFPFPGRPPASKGNLITFIKVSIVGAVATRKGKKETTSWAAHKTPPALFSQVRSPSPSPFTISPRRDREKEGGHTY